MKNDARAVIRIHPEDNVAVALRPLAAGDTVETSGGAVTVRQEIPKGHKVALSAIPAGERIIKYGFSIGIARTDIQPGEWVHEHNVRTALDASGSYVYEPKLRAPQPAAPELFEGYIRKDGRAAIRNEIWILPMVGCVNSIVSNLARAAQTLVRGNIDGIYAFEHPYGCSQLGDDHANTQKLLAALADHPNAGGVLIVGLGCENNTMASFRERLHISDPERIRFMVCQDEAHEMQTGLRLLGELADYAGTFRRQPVPVDKLVIGLKCGGSDGLSGITANPAVGRVTDLLTARGGSAVLTEVPEMFGAEQVLLDRCENEAVYAAAVKMICDFKQYFVSHGQTVYENPSPGNRAGGITTLEDKSIGCVQKGGSATVRDVIGYAGQVRKNGLTLLSGPGNDLVSATALAAAGAHMILFTTGRGTPFGAPVPTLKIASNSELFRKKPGWMDFNAGTAAEDEPMDRVAERLYRLVLDTAGGRKTRTEEHGIRGMAIFKDGVTL